MVGLRFVEDLRHLNPKFFFSEEQGLEETILDIIKDEDVETVVFVDTCDLGGKPGDISLLQLDSISETVSTHKVPLSMLMALIQTEGKKAYLVGIQPESMDFRGEMTANVVRALDKVEGAVKKAIKA